METGDASGGNRPARRLTSVNPSGYDYHRIRSLDTRRRATRKGPRPPSPPRRSAPCGAPNGSGALGFLRQRPSSPQLLWASGVDIADSGRVVVVNERRARTIWPGASPIGKRFKQGWPESEGENSRLREVVGVVSDVNQDGLDEPARMEVFLTVHLEFVVRPLLVVTADGTVKSSTSA